MTKEDVININKQVKAFHEKYGEYPKYPIRISYAYNNVNAEGDLKPIGSNNASKPTLVGYPGFIHHSDDKCFGAFALFDGKGRMFPGVKYADCVDMKPNTRA